MAASIAATMLERVIESGEFTSGFEACANPNPYASNIESVARGVLALAKAGDGGLVADITGCTAIVDSRTEDQFGPRRKFIAFNAKLPGYDRKQPQGSCTWAPYGEIGLRAIILETGYSYNGPVAIMTLVLPVWERNGQSPVDEGALSFADIVSDGRNIGHRYALFLDQGEGGESPIGARLSLQYLLGMGKPAGKICMMDSILWGAIDDSVGFPGAENYLVTKLPELGNYLKDLAVKLDA